MQMQVSATRMELLRLKKRLKLAQRGHKLLKDKQEELMRRFLELIKDYEKLRKRVEEALGGALRGFLVARAVMLPAYVEETLISSQSGTELDVSTAHIMNTAVPIFKLEQKGDIYSYGFAGTSADLDQAYEHLSDVLSPMVELAEKEKTIELLADEIEKTRRRVNALEYVLIPSLEEALSSIAMRLGEMERSNIARLMRIKEIIRRH